MITETDSVSETRFPLLNSATGKANIRNSSARTTTYYTPQMIVDGTRQFEGHNAGKALQAIGEAAKEAKGDVAIEIEKLENREAKLKIKIENLPPMSKNDNEIVLLAVTEDNLSTLVTSGENSGNELPHVAVARQLQNIGSINREGKTFSQTIVLDKS